jgi:hypothetical protein
MVTPTLAGVAAAHRAVSPPWNQCSDGRRDSFRLKWRDGRAPFFAIGHSVPLEEPARQLDFGPRRRIQLTAMPPDRIVGHRATVPRAPRVEVECENVWGNGIFEIVSGRAGVSAGRQEGLRASFYARRD